MAATLGLDLDPRSPGLRRAIEVYPHAATVALFRLHLEIQAKTGPAAGAAPLRAVAAGLLLLMDGVERLADAEVRLHVADHRDWGGLRAQVTTARHKSKLRRAEDPVDAVVCAYVALYSVRCPARVTI